MESDKQNLGEFYAARAMTAADTSAFPISIPKIREPLDMVYNGTINDPSNATAAVHGIQSPHNKKLIRQKVSPFTAIVMLLGVAVASVLYIDNILSVGRLMHQINQLQIKHQQILNDQELLKAQVNRLSSLERIQQIAHDQLGLQNPNQLPIWIEINPERVKQVEEVIQQRMEQKQ